MIKDIFFDLDRTLWDFEASSHETLLELCISHNLSDKGIADYEAFIKNYKIHNDKLWELYRVDKISQKDLRRERFQRTLADYNIEDVTLAEKIGEDYVATCPKKNKLFPHTIEVLNYLSVKYKLHIITNGFHEVQHIKLKHAGLSSYFDKIITSEQVGVKKPNPKIFKYALQQANAEECIMIGDDLEVDVLGAEQMGIQGIFFNPNKTKHNTDIVHEIFCLSELKALL
ncbi:MAG: noncanonical pyrimidine nucleotidase, YjjG family [Flavobacteriales bacterium]|mgnify:FL=1|jgi:putative hydrolase of the HAD superfamily|nr:noncanonical pyrimidine nucleotidase, YjjG family [Flavobacteriales bacterium]MBT5090543.1 noncanonical pyrimidine nucleotidase, YjjG family [Flavobacteriales bacterium]MBT5750833.1 noncanonical pyrimidine nucleotidase, YjjG family [Flavobacteriales bacterium]